MQDMSKVYDLINRKISIRSLKRLKISKEFCTLIENSLKNRSNQIITKWELTNEYVIGNGID